MPRPRKDKKQIRQHVKEVVQQAIETAIQEEEALEERVPGKVVNKLKTTWTPKDVEAVFPLVTFTPEETLAVTYNGVVYQLISQVEMQAPSIVKTIYERSRRRLAQVGRALRGLGITVEAGVGGLPPS